MIPIGQTTTTSEILDAETRRTVDLKRLIRTLDALVTSAPVTINQDGVRLRATDPKMVGLIDLHLKPAFFTQYQAPKATHKFAIDTGDFKQRICEARKGDTVRLAVTDEHETRTVRVTVDDRGMTSTFTIPTNSLEDDEIPETDDLEFTGRAVVAVGALKDAIDRMGTSAQLTLHDDRLVIESTTENGAASVEFLEGSDHLHAIHLDDGPITASYATDYLKHVIKLKNTVDRVHLRFGTDYPLRIEADRDTFAAAYTLAPRIE